MREERVVVTGLFAWLVITAAWWLLAFWPAPDAPVWLERTRFVCFGVNHTGLPDGGGWIGLIAGPLGMLAILLVGGSRSLASALRRARTSLPLALTLAIIPLGIILITTGATWRVTQLRTTPVSEPAFRASSYPRLDLPAPPIELVAQDGATHTLAALRGRPVLVTFAFAHCETVCPLVVSHAVKAQQMLLGARSHPALLVVTIDPWRDTPSRLPAMAQAWRLPQQDAWVLSGSVDAVGATLSAWKIPVRRDERTGDVVHPSAIYIVDAKGRIAFVASGGAATIAALTRRL